jgi:acyl-CoA thioesterase
MSSEPLSRFDRDTAFVRRSASTYDVSIDRGWWIVRGPNGGYIAALLANVVRDTVGDPDRPLRSLTVHYLRPPSEGPATIDTTVERSGRTVTTVTARLEQNGKLQALATAAHAVPRDTGGFDHMRMPEVAPPEQCPRRSLGEPSPIPMHDRYEQRTAIGPESRTAPRTREAVTGGWIRLTEPRPWDATLIAAIADAWPPAVFTTHEMPEVGGGVPTVDLTSHIIAPDAIAALAPSDFVLVRFETRIVRGGYLEEDGDIWSPTGQLLARARQIGVVL